MSKARTVEEVQVGDLIDAGRPEGDAVWVTVVAVEIGEQVETPVLIHTEELAFPLVAQFGEEID
jgi:hypothetical protein